MNTRSFETISKLFFRSLGILFSSLFFWTQAPQTFAQNIPSPATVKKQTTHPSAKQPTDDQQFEQRKISEVHLWTCENQVSLKTAQSEKGLMLLWNKKLYQFSEVDALTGATKFIDLNNQLHWLVIPEKAMLLNSKLGQRLLDHCKSPAHSNLVSASPQ